MAFTGVAPRLRQLSRRNSVENHEWNQTYTNSEEGEERAEDSFTVTDR